jgi:hypothetical protein
MRAVTQDRMGSPWGNCLEACYATLLGVPIEEVPDPRDLCGEDTCAADVLKLRVQAISDWLAQEFGVAVVRGDGAKPPGVLLRRSDVPLLWIASGPGPRGYNHATVYSNGNLLWDPHPSRAGLLSVTMWSVLVPTGPIWNRLAQGWVLPLEGVRRSNAQDTEGVP